MKYNFYVFSGSGNTDKFCRAMEKELVAMGNESEYWLFRKGEKYPSFGECDAAVFGFPVHAFNAPAPVIEFLGKVPEGRGRRAYLAATSGEPLTLNDCAFFAAEKILTEKGWQVCGEYRYVMPYNIIFRHSDGMAARMWRIAEANAAKAAKEMAEGIIRLAEPKTRRKAVSAAFRIEHAAMPLIGRGFRATDECVGCGLCERVCPQANIYIENGRPTFGKNCVGCMGCAFSCPKNAIRTGLLDKWRVNGKYDFNAKPAGDKEICRYLEKTYLKYFQKEESVLK